MTKTETPKTPELTLLPLPVGLIGGGALAAIAAQVFVSVDDFTRIYEVMGYQLPYLLVHLIEHPVLLPAAYLLVAVGALLAPRLVLSRCSQRIAEAVCGLATLGLGCVLLHAVGVAWLLPRVLNEVQKALVQ